MKLRLIFILLSCVWVASTWSLNEGVHQHNPDDDSQDRGKYNAAVAALTPASTIREYRRALTTLEGLAQSHKGGAAAADAMAVLSKVYLFGTHNKKIVTQQQPDKSFAYANQSSHLGSAQGHDMLAFHLRFGLGVEQNRDKARIIPAL